MTVIERAIPIAWNNSRKVLKSMKSVDTSENYMNQMRDKKLSVPPGDKRASTYGKSIKC